MAKYRLTAPHVIGGTLLDCGAVVENVDPTPDMVPLDDDAARVIKEQHWSDRGWRVPITAESLPGGRHSDGSPVLLNRPENLGRPMTYNPPQPDFRKEIPPGTAAEPIEPAHPPEEYWQQGAGSLKPSDPVVPYGSKPPGSKGA